MYVTRISHVIYSVLFYPRFHITAVCLGTYYLRIRRSACILEKAYELALGQITAEERNIDTFEVLRFLLLLIQTSNRITLTFSSARAF